MIRLGEETSLLRIKDLEKAAAEMIYNIHIRKQYIYIIWAIGSGTVKIGKSNNPHSRVRQIQTGCPHKVIMLAAFPEITDLSERRMHQTLKHLRTESKTEWFYMDDAIIDIVNLANNGDTSQRSKKIRDYINSLETLQESNLSTSIGGKA